MKYITLEAGILWWYHCYNIVWLLNFLFFLLLFFWTQAGFAAQGAESGTSFDDINLQEKVNTVGTACPLHTTVSTLFWQKFDLKQGQFLKLHCWMSFIWSCIHSRFLCFLKMTFIHAIWQTLVLYISGLDRLRRESQGVGGNIRGHTPVQKVLMSLVISLREGQMNTAANQASFLASKGAADAEVAWSGGGWTLTDKQDRFYIHVVGQHDQGFFFFTASIKLKGEHSELSFFFAHLSVLFQ